MTRIAVIESDEYREEEAALKADPILRAMAAEIPAGIDTESWDFMGRAGDEYRRRGGQHGRTIGGPARAITALRAEAKS